MPSRSLQSWPPEEFFNRFPEGIYEVEGLSLEGEELGGEAEITHFMPAPAGNLLISGLTAANDCDSVLPVPSLPLIISWDPVTNSHPDLGITNSPITVVGYQVVLDREEPTPLKLTFDLPPGGPTVVEIPLWPYFLRG